MLNRKILKQPTHILAQCYQIQLCSSFRKILFFRKVRKGLKRFMNGKQQYNSWWQPQSVLLVSTWKSPINSSGKCCNEFIFSPIFHYINGLACMECSNKVGDRRVLIQVLNFNGQSNKLRVDAKLCSVTSGHILLHTMAWVLLRVFIFAQLTFPHKM